MKERERWAVPLGLAAMDLCWLYPWATLIGAWLPDGGGRPLLSAAAVALLLLAGWGATRAAWRLRWPLPRVRLALTLLGLLLVLVVVGADQAPSRDLPLAAWLLDLLRDAANVVNGLSASLLAVAAGWGLWWRGLARGRRVPDHEDVEGVFGLGATALVLFLLAALATSGGDARRHQEATGGWVLGFFFVGLLTLALARIETIREAHDAADRTLGLNRHWLGAVVGITAGLVVAAGLLAHLLSFDLLRLVLGPFVPFLEGLLFLVLVIVSIPFALLLELLLLLATAVMEALARAEVAERLGLGELLAALRDRPPVRLVTDEVWLAVRWLLVALGLGLAAALFVRGIRRFRPRPSGSGVVEERESLWDEATAAAALAAWLRAALARLRRPPPPSPGPPRLTDAADGPPSVREIYRRLLALGAIRGAPRHPSATPHEHRPSLSAALDAPRAVGEITAAYARARYGEQREDEDETAAARAHWSDLAGGREPATETPPLRN